MDLVQISPEISVSDLFARWPVAIPIFIKRQMSCVGCGMASFDTLEDVARIYGIPVEDLIQEIVQLVGLTG
jgi:hybrid cluster-associated redox disulfide protein